MHVLPLIFPKVFTILMRMFMFLYLVYIKMPIILTLLSWKRKNSDTRKILELENNELSEYDFMQLIANRHKSYHYLLSLYTYYYINPILTFWKVFIESVATDYYLNKHLSSRWINMFNSPLLLYSQVCVK